MRQATKQPDNIARQFPGGPGNAPPHTGPPFSVVDRHAETCRFVGRAVTWAAAQDYS